jgi:hypothetical protein
MKRIVFALVLMAISLSGFTQKSVDALFSKYSGEDGFTTITINGNLLKLIRAFDNNDEDNFWPGDVSSIRILVQDDEGFYAGNFFSMVERELDRKNYEEFMRINDSGNDVVMLVRSQGRSFTEFLVVAGDDDGEDNVLIQVKGNMTYKEAKEFADKIKEDHGADIVISCR